MEGIGTVGAPVPAAPMSATTNAAPVAQDAPPPARPTAPPSLERALAALPTTPPTTMPGHNTGFRQNQGSNLIAQTFYQKSSSSQNIRAAAQNTLDRAIAQHTPPSLPPTNSLPNSVSRVPNSINILPNSVNKVPNSINSSPNSVNNFPNHVNSLPNSTNSLPIPINNLSNSVNRVPNSINSSPNSVNSFPKPIAQQTPPSLPPTNSLPNSVNNFPNSMNRAPLFARQTSLPNNTIVTAQGIWKNVNSQTESLNTLPAVQNFIQLAYQTFQNVSQPQLAPAPRHVFAPNIVVTPRSPQTSLPPPFPSLQKQQEPPKTDQIPKQTNEKINGLTQNKSDSIDKGNYNQPATSKTQYYPPPHYTMYTSKAATPGNSKPQPKSPKKAETANVDSNSPSRRPVLVAKRRSNPKPEQDYQAQSPAKTQSTKAQNAQTSVDKTQSPKAQVPKASQSAQPSVDKTQSPKVDKTEKAKANQIAQPKNSPSKQNPLKVAQTFKEPQREKEQAAQGRQAAASAGQAVASPEQAVASPGQAAASAGKQSWRRTTSIEEEEEIDPKKRVLVLGFPAYTQWFDVSRVLSTFGTCQVDSCRNRLAVVTFENEAQAKNAMKASDDIKIFGEFIEIRPYTNPRHVEELYKAYKKVLTVQKGREIIMPDKINLTGDFHSQMSAVQSAIRLSPDEALAVNNLYNDLELVLQQEWPGCIAIPFGSIPTGLGIKSSDADCYVELPSRYRPRSGAASTFVTRARRLLQQYPNVFTNLIAIPRANTPILKFRHKPSGFHCDVSAKTPLGTQNSKLIKLLFEHDVRLQRVAILIKYWAKVHDLSGTGRLTNYALTMMVIFYLQQTRVPFLPPIQKLQEEPDTRFIVDYWNAGFLNKKLPVVEKEKTIPQIFGQFFEYYEKFDFDMDVVCPYLGRPVKKEAFENFSSLPLEFSRYIGNVKENLASPIRHGTSFCVQDPFEQSHNVASSVGRKLSNDIRAYIKYAAEAYRKDQENGYDSFLRTILRTKPDLRPQGVPCTSLLKLIPRVRGVITEPDWQKCLREIVVDTIFKEILRLVLEVAPLDEKEMNEAQIRPKLRQEKYCGCATKPVWQRKKSQRPSFLAAGAQQALIRDQAAITDEILAREDNDIKLTFELELWFKETPRTFEVLLRLLEGDMNSFKPFVLFLHTMMVDWFRVLLRPHQAPLNEPPEVTMKTDAVENTIAKLDFNLTFETESPAPDAQQIVTLDNVAEKLEAVKLDSEDSLDRSQVVSQ